MSDDTLVSRIAASIRTAVCHGDCGATEEECARQRLQPCVWHHGVLTEVLGSPEVFAAVAASAVPLPELRAAVLREEADRITAYCPTHGQLEPELAECHCTLAHAMHNRANTLHPAPAQEN